MPATLARRYFFKLVANLVSVPVYLAMEAILPRALGPRAYGDYSFATNLFQQMSGFLDMGSSTCFFNALSRRQKETSLFAFYLRVALLVLCLTALVGFVLLYPPLGELVMPAAPLWYAPLAAFWAFLTWWSRVLRSVNDAVGATQASELWRSALSLAALGLLLALYFGDSLSVGALFCQQYLFLGSCAVAFWLVARRFWRRNDAVFSLALTKRSEKAYAREFFNYSHPLFAQALLSFLLLTCERWLLQWFDGSAQQGFYALSQKVSMACFLFVSAMTPLLMREFSIAWGRKDLRAMGSLLARFAPALYALAAYFSCFTAIEAESLVRIFGGSEFAAAVLPVQIMALYPLHQAYGQMAGSVFHASGKTRILRDVAAIECLYGLTLAWLFVAPADLYGLNLGATGLAVKTVVGQFLTVNIYLWLASRFIPFSFWRNLRGQLLCVCVFLGLACAARFLSALAAPDADFLIRFALSGVVYTFLIFCAGLAFPGLAGMSRRELKELLIRFRLRRR